MLDTRSSVLRAPRPALHAHAPKHRNTGTPEHWASGLVTNLPSSAICPPCSAPSPHGPSKGQCGPVLQPVDSGIRTISTIRTDSGIRSINLVGALAAFGRPQCPAAAGTPLPGIRTISTIGTDSGICTISKTTTDSGICTISLIGALAAFGRPQCPTAGGTATPESAAGGLLRGVYVSLTRPPPGRKRFSPVATPWPRRGNVAATLRSARGQVAANPTPFFPRNALFPCKRKLRFFARQNSLQDPFFACSWLDARVSMLDAQPSRPTSFILQLAFCSALHAPCSKLMHRSLVGRSVPPSAGPSRSAVVVLVRRAVDPATASRPDRPTV
jgi:hypothetical protein